MPSNVHATRQPPPFGHQAAVFRLRVRLICKTRESNVPWRTVRRVLPHVALLLVYLMTPSAGELLENVVHLVTKGHAAHAFHDDAHTPTDPEHGCSGPFHVCCCHSSIVFTAPLVAADVSAPVATDTNLGGRHESVLPHGHLRRLFRPPIA